MALQTPIVTISEHIREIQKDLFSVIFRMVVTDDTAGYDGLDEHYTIRYRPGDSVADKVVEITAAFQARIESYEVAKAIEEHSATATALVNIQNGLVV